ncbi:hypothetical protein NKDENANG_00657 [Candidatus Entotheonellaceae bacterium PAL068K]
MPYLPTSLHNEVVKPTRAPLECGIKNAVQTTEAVGRQLTLFLLTRFSRVVANVDARRFTDALDLWQTQRWMDRGGGKVVASDSFG